jgi:hypothetical protein
VSFETVHKHISTIRSFRVNLHSNAEVLLDLPLNEVTQSVAKSSLLEWLERSGYTVITLNIKEHNSDDSRNPTILHKKKPGPFD